MSFTNYLSLILNKQLLSIREVSHFNNCTISHVAEGIIEITPSAVSNESTAYIYSCGIHGNETAPIEIVNDLLSDIATGKIQIHHPLLIIFGHLPAMRKSTRFIQDNLNRMFSDEFLSYPDNDVEAPRAKLIQKEIARFYHQYSNHYKVHYDLHTAIRPSIYRRFAVYPYLKSGRNISKRQLQLFSTMGIEAVLFMHKRATTLSFYSSDVHGADAFTLELGKVEKFGENRRDDFSKAEGVLRALISNTKFDFEQKLPVLCQVKKELIRHEKNYQFNISDDTANFTSYRRGDVLASDSVETYTVQEDGEMIAFPNGRVKVGQRSGLILTTTKLENL